MANREKGEFGITIGGTVYTLALTLDAMVAVEDLFSTPSKEVTFQEVAERAERGSIRATRALIWCLFREHHPQIEIKDISRIMKQAGGVDAISAITRAAILASAPDALDVAEIGGKSDRPLEAQADNNTAGTGAGSTSSTAVSA